MRNVRGLRTLITPAMETHMFTLNMARAPISDVRVRRALTAAFDYDAQAVYVWKRLGTIPRGFLPTRMKCFNNSIPVYKEDLFRARELLQQAGAGGARLSMNFTQGREDLKQAAVIFQDTLRNLGVTLDVRETPWPSLFEQQRRADGAPHMVTLIQSAFTADPTTMMESSFHSRNIEKPYNWSIFRNTEYDRLIDEARGTLDKTKRCEMLGRAQKIIYDEEPAIFFASPPRLETSRIRVKGYVPHPSDYFWSVKWYQLSLED
ncbi:MAG: hypothetical protein FJX78_07690 [Armatimonadetes bacterium]|nr:hypothetical protein [Armatimonadota bacterium]